MGFKLASLQFKRRDGLTAIAALGIGLLSGASVTAGSSSSPPVTSPVGPGSSPPGPASPPVVVPPNSAPPSGGGNQQPIPTQPPPLAPSPTGTKYYVGDVLATRDITDTVNYYAQITAIRGAFPASESIYTMFWHYGNSYPSFYVDYKSGVVDNDPNWYKVR